MNSRQRRNRWLRTFVEGEFYYYNGLNMYVPRVGSTGYYQGIKPEDQILVKCLDPQIDNTTFYGQVIFGNDILSPGDIRNFNKVQFYRMQKPIEDES